LRNLAYETLRFGRKFKNSAGRGLAQSGGDENVFGLVKRTQRQGQSAILDRYHAFRPAAKCLFKLA